MLLGQGHLLLDVHFEVVDTAVLHQDVVDFSHLEASLKSHDTLMVQFLQNRNLLVYIGFYLRVVLGEFLQSVNSVRLLVLALVDLSVCTFTKQLSQLVPV